MRTRWAHRLYSALMVALGPLYVARLWWRGRAEPLYRHAIGERLGTYRGAASEGPVWVHAVSLGETRAAAALLDALRAALPGVALLLTHGTATGRTAGKALLRPGDQQVWLPYDTPRVVDRFFARFRPVVGVLMETEVWPNLLLAARQRGVPMVLASARLSERSLRKGQRLDPVLRPAAERLTLVLAQTEGDAERLRSAGAPRVVVCGNLKFDAAPEPELLARGELWRQRAPRGVVLAASTREGEEAALLEAWRRPAQAGAEGAPLLLLVPRHPQRFDEVERLVRQAGFSVARRSGWSDAPPDTAWQADVWLGDSMGEMPLYYALAQVALLGGSFAPLGGQNLIEAAACGCPVVMGPHTFNFAQAAELSLEAGASLRVASIEEGVAEALRLTADPARQTALSTAATAFSWQHRGAAERMARWIAGLVEQGETESANGDRAAASRH